MSFVTRRVLYHMYFQRSDERESASPCVMTHGNLALCLIIFFAVKQIRYLGSGTLSTFLQSVL